MFLINRLIPLYVSRAQLIYFNNYSSYFMRWKCNTVFSKCAFTSQRCFSSEGRNKILLPLERECLRTFNRYYNYRFPLSTALSLRKYSDKPEVSPDNVQKAVDDEEFQNILKDFAKDFGVNSESAEILEDIRKDNESRDEKRTNTDTQISSRASETLDVYHSMLEERFQEFVDKESQIIHSYEEEQFLEQDEVFHVDQEYESQVKTHQVKRGLTGVFDLEELIPILREEKLFDISVIKIPEHFSYADYMVLATAKSLRHLRAVTEFVLRFHKMKKNSKDPFIKIEGEKMGTWKAMDMGNIVLHVFLEDTRAVYDIESLWLLDEKYDTGGKLEDDTVLEMMQEEMEFLNCLKSNENNTINHKTVE